MSKKWVTSDHHFGHENIIKHGNGPFINTDDMQEQMISRWNSVVRPNDLVYHLGDLYYCIRTIDAHAILDRLNGKIFFIEGNHDQVAAKMKGRFVGYERLHQIEIGVQKVALVRPAMRVWRNSFHGSSTFTAISTANCRITVVVSFDVGVDAGWDFTPVPEDQVGTRMNAKIDAMKGQTHNHGVQSIIPDS